MEYEHIQRRMVISGTRSMVGVYTSVNTYTGIYRLVKFRTKISITKICE